MESRVPENPDNNEIDPLRTESFSSESVHHTHNGDLSTFLNTLNDGYTVLEALPRGGQAVVYKAIQK